MTLLYLLLFLLLPACVSQTVTGKDGSPGANCSVQQITNGAIITCPDSTAVVSPAGSQYNVQEIVDPCGDGPGFDEVILRLANGQLLAHFSSGGLQFLSLIPDGNYVTTDQQACQFTVSNGIVVP